MKLGSSRVIERQLLNKVIAEQKLSLTEVIEQSAAQRLGKVLGIDAIASGTVLELAEAQKCFDDFGKRSTFTSNPDSRSKTAVSRLQP